MAEKKELKGRAVGIAALGLGNTAASVSFQWDKEGTEAPGVKSGFLLRVVDNKNYAACFVQGNVENKVTAVVIYTVVASALVSINVVLVTGVSRTASCTFGAMILGPRYFLYFGQGSNTELVAVGDFAELGTTLKTGTAYLYDENSGTHAVTRTYDQVGVWAPTGDAVIYANRSAFLSTQGIYRQSEDGEGSRPVAYPGTDLPRLPASGTEETPVEIAVAPSRGDTLLLPDSGKDKFKVQLAYRPCFGEIPES